MASTATGCLAEKSSADVIIQIAKPVLRQKKLFLVTKRVFDIVCSFLGLLILAIPMMIIALIITIDSPGAPIFKQERLGINGKPFMIYNSDPCALMRRKTAPSGRMNRIQDARTLAKSFGALGWTNFPSFITSCEAT